MPSLTGSHADSVRLSYHRFDVHRSSFSRWYAAWTWTPRQNSTGMYYTVYLWCMQYTITLPSLQWITVLWQIIWMPLSRKTGTYDIYDILVPIFFERIPGEKKMAVTILLVYYCPHNWESLSSWTQISRAHQARLGFTSTLLYRDLAGKMLWDSLALACFASMPGISKLLPLADRKSVV